MMNTHFKQTIWNASMRGFYAYAESYDGHQAWAFFWRAADVDNWNPFPEVQ